MRDDLPVRRKGKRLLVATIGVATVSYMGLHGGCTEDGEMVVVANLLVPPVETSHDPSLVDASAHDAGQDALVGSGNLLPPPVTSGNLLPPPTDAALDASGNLLPPPTDASLDGAADAATDAAHPADAAHPKDAKIDTGLPSSGNLLPIPPRETR